MSIIERMFALLGQFESIAERLAAAVGAMRPEVTRAEDAIKLLEALTTIERLAAAGRTLLAPRIEESRVWQRDGHRTASSWLAATTGRPLGDAIGSLETGKRLEQLPATKDAFVAGKLSEAQTREIAAVAPTDPQIEASLVDTAQEATLPRLREACLRVAAQADDATSRYEAIRRRRYLRHWTEPDGAVRIDARLTPDDGAHVIATLDARKEHVFRAARRAGLREPYAAYAADALVQLARDDTDDAKRGPRAMIHVIVDHGALTRGSTQGGERCEIPGIGPIPVATARALASDSILKVLVTDGVDVRAVAHAGRTIPARLRTALEQRDQTCVVPGCDVRHGLEIDHYRVAFADGGSTALDNLARLCRWHHYLKTHCGFLLSGAPGAWQWGSPDDLEGAAARPPPAA